MVVAPAGALTPAPTASMRPFAMTSVARSNRRPAGPVDDPRVGQDDGAAGRLRGGAGQREESDGSADRERENHRDQAARDGSPTLVSGQNLSRTMFRR